jgi:hypothetical protein
LATSGLVGERFARCTEFFGCPGDTLSHRRFGFVMSDRGRHHLTQRRNVVRTAVQGVPASAHDEGKCFIG